MGGGDDYFPLYYKTPLSNSDHISKKWKLSTVKRFFKNPGQINPICREVHAPRRQSRFVNYKGISENLGTKMGNLLSTEYAEIKNNDKEVIDIEGMESRVCEKIDLFGYIVKETNGSLEIVNGLDSSRRWKKDVVVINIDDDVDTSKDGGSELSCSDTSKIQQYRCRIVQNCTDFGGSDAYPVELLECPSNIGSEYSSIEEVEPGSGKRNYLVDGFDSSRCSKKDTEVICVDGDVDTAKEGGSKDSSIEDLEAGGGKRNELLKEGGIGKNPPGDSCLYATLYEIMRSSVKKMSDGRQFLIEYLEKCHKIYRLLRPQKKGEDVKEDLIKKAFVHLSEEEKNEVFHALSIWNRKRVLVTHENSNITGEILQCLRPRQWLNDEVINLYLELLKEREKREPQKFLKCHFFNTFFYKKLVSGKGGYNYQSVRRWTSQGKLGYSLFECDKIFVPIHQQKHWCLAVINKKDEKFQYLDSFRGRDTQVLKVLAKYFVDEVKDKNGKDIDVSSWKQEFVQDLPEQKNGFDCGMFMIKYADFYSRDIGLCFNQEHMLYFRQRTAMELLSLKAN